MKFIHDEETITQAQNGSKQAMEAIVESNMGLVKSIAVRFCHRGTEFEDLVQIGCIGMIKAIHRFDPTLKLSFSTYAVPLIIGEIRRHLRDDGIIKVSRSAKINNARICAFITEYKEKNGKEPSLTEISSALQIAEEDVIFAMDASRPLLSLNQRDEETGFSPEDLAGDDAIEERFDNIALEEALSSLSPEEERLIRLRYFKHLTQEQTARILRVTQVKVSRDERKICQKLKKLLE